MFSAVVPESARETKKQRNARNADDQHETVMTATKDDDGKHHAIHGRAAMKRFQKGVQKTIALQPVVRSFTPAVGAERKAPQIIQAAPETDAGNRLASAVLGNWIIRRAEIVDRYSGRVEIAGRRYSCATPQGQKLYDDLQECVLVYESWRKEERENDDFVQSLISGVGASAVITPEVVRDRYDQLVEDKRYLMEVLAAGFVRVRGDSSVNKIGYSRLKLSGSGTKEIVFVPAGTDLDQERIQDVISRKHWSVKMPNMVTKLDFGNCHPSDLATIQLADAEQFAEVREAATIMNRDPDHETDVRLRLGCRAQQIDDSPSAHVLCSECCVTTWFSTASRWP
jgi:hypothetical protein